MWSAELMGRSSREAFSEEAPETAPGWATQQSPRSMATVYQGGGNRGSYEDTGITARWGRELGDVNAIGDI